MVPCKAVYLMLVVCLGDSSKTTKLCGPCHTGDRSNTAPHKEVRCVLLVTLCFMQKYNGPRVALHVRTVRALDTPRTLQMGTQIYQNTKMIWT